MVNCEGPGTVHTPQNSLQFLARQRTKVLFVESWYPPPAFKYWQHFKKLKKFFSLWFLLLMLFMFTQRVLEEEISKTLVFKTPLSVLEFLSIRWEWFQSYYMSKGFTQIVILKYFNINVHCGLIEKYENMSTKLSKLQHFNIIFHTACSSLFPVLLLTRSGLCIYLPLLVWYI